jgi:hypothetical protein
MIRFKLSADMAPTALALSKTAVERMSEEGLLPLITVYGDVRDATGKIVVVAPDFVTRNIRANPLHALIYIEAMKSFLEETIRPPDDQRMEHISLKDRPAGG